MVENSESQLEENIVVDVLNDSKLEIASQMIMSYESPRSKENDQTDREEAQMLIDKAVSILQEYQVEATDEILESFNNLESSSAPKEQFFEALMRTLAEHI